MHQWHILCVEPNREHTARSHLFGRRFRSYLPLRATSRRKDAPMFPGYLFAQIDPDQPMTELSVLPRLTDHLQVGDFVHSAAGPRISVYDRVRMLPGVRDFLRVDDHLATLSDNAIEAILSAERDLAASAKEPANGAFPIGSTVRTTDSAGVWSGYQGIVRRLDKEDRLVLDVIVPGKQMKKVTLRAQWLEPVETAPRKGRHAGALA